LKPEGKAWLGRNRARLELGSVPAADETRGGSSVNFYAAISCSATTGTASSARSAATSKSIPA
jgi:hypothetical protein